MSKWLVALAVLALALGAAVLWSGPSDDEASVSSDGIEGTSGIFVGAAPTAADSNGAPIGLSAYLEQASTEWVMMSTETATFLGLTDELGMRDDGLDPLTEEYDRQVLDHIQSMVDRIDVYPADLLTEEERLTAEIYRWYLQDYLDYAAFSDQGYLVGNMFASYPQDLEWFLTSFHAVETLENAEDYISRLAQIPDRFEELTVALAKSEAIGAVAPGFILETDAEWLRWIAETPATETNLYVAFEEQVTASESIPSEAKQDLLDQAETVLEIEVLPSFADLSRTVSDLAARTDDTIGVWKHDNGDAYYEYLLHSYTTTDLSADEIHNLGLIEVDRIRSEMSDAAEALGYSRALSIRGLYAELTVAAGTSIGQETIDRCADLLDSIAARVRPAFGHWPTEELIVVEGYTTAFFSPGALDGSRPGMFFAPTMSEQPNYSLPTVTYHEGIPGHFLQSAFAHETDIPTYLAAASFTGYAEGWALYAERLAWEMGAYENDPYGNMGRLQDEMLRAARLVVDTGIHAMHWGYEQAVTYMLETTGMSEEFVREEVERYAVLPGQATAYKVGMLKLLELRSRAELALGESFDLREFHDIVLGHGELPLAILEELVDDYIADKSV